MSFLCLKEKNSVFGYIPISLILVLCMGCASASQPLSGSSDLVDIIKSYKIKYHDQDVMDEELLGFFTEGFKSEYLKQKDQGFRFLKGLLPTSLNAPILIAEPETQEEKECKNIHFEHVPDSSRCLLIVGRTVDQVRKKVVVVFAPFDGSFKISSIGTFNSID